MPAISSTSSMEGSSAERSRFRMMGEICAKLATTPSFPDAFITQGKALLLVRLCAHIQVGIPNHLDDHLHSLFRNSQLRHLLYTHTPSPFSTSVSTRQYVFAANSSFINPSPCQKFCPIRNSFRAGALPLASQKAMIRAATSVRRLF